MRTSFDASSSAWPGATSAISLTVNCRFERGSVRRSEPALDPRDVVDAHRPAADGTVSRPICLDVARAGSSSTRILTGYCSAPSLKIEIWSSPETASRSVLPIVAIRTPRSAARLRSTATWTSGFDRLRSIFTSVRLGHLLRLGERLLRVLGDLLEVGPENVGRDREPALLRRRRARFRDVMLGL